MGHHEVHILVTLADLVAVEPGRGLLVQRVEDRAARTFGQAAITGRLGHFVHHDRVGDVGLDTDLARDLFGDQAAQVRGVLHRGVRKVVLHRLVHLVHARFDGLDEPAAADDGRKLPHVESLLGERLEDHVLAPLQLVDDVGEGGDLLRRVAQGEVQLLGIVVEKGHLGRGGAGVDG